MSMPTVAAAGARFEEMVKRSTGLGDEEKNGRRRRRRRSSITFSADRLSVSERQQGDTIFKFEDLRGEKKADCRLSSAEQVQVVRSQSDAMVLKTFCHRIAIVTAGWEKETNQIRGGIRWVRSALL